MPSLIEDDFLAEAYNRALDLEKSGDIDAAIDAYRSILVMDPDDHGGVSVRLAALGAEGAKPQKAPDAYVATLFDQHAEVFEAILCDQLGYDVPQLIADMLATNSNSQFKNMLDIGCGTGLVAEALGERVAYSVGFDLSEGMVDIAYDKELYDALYVAEAVDFLAENDDAPFELIVAADLFPYLGDINALIAGVALNCTNDALFVFSTQARAENEPDDFAVGADHRFQHKIGYVRAALESHGFSVIAVKDINVRNENEQPTPGHLVLAKR